MIYCLPACGVSLESSGTFLMPRHQTEPCSNINGKSLDWPVQHTVEWATCYTSVNDQIVCKRIWRKFLLSSKFCHGTPGSVQHSLGKRQPRGHRKTSDGEACVWTNIWTQDHLIWHMNGFLWTADRNTKHAVREASHGYGTQKQCTDCKIKYYSYQLFSESLQYFFVYSLCLWMLLQPSVSVLFPLCQQHTVFCWHSKVSTP